MLLLATATAATLDFTRFELVAGEDGVQLDYELVADDWTSIAAERAQGLPTSVSVTLVHDEVRYIAVVPMSAASRSVSVALRPWPVGSTAELAVREGSFDSVHVGDAEGTVLSLKVSGGVEGVDPANPPLSSDPREPRREAQPVTSLPAVPRPAPPPTPAPVRAADVDETEVIAACRQTFAGTDEQGTCIATLLNRTHPIDELNACRALTRVRHQRTCVESLDKAPDGVHLMLQACQQGLGHSGDALNCMLTAKKLDGDVVPAIQACTKHIRNAGDAVGCVKRAVRLDYDPDPLLQACAVGFPEDPLQCMSRATRSKYDRTDLVNACTTAFDRGLRDRCLSLLAPAAGPDAGGAVRACTALFEGDYELECLARARTAPSEERIRHCGELRSRRDQLDCIGG